MAIIGEWIRRLGYLLRRRAREDELRREMEEHRAQMGEPPAFGNTLRLREEARDAWGWRWLDDLVQDTRFAWRTLRQSPGFALTAIVTLALGIGVNIAMFSLINGLLLRPLYAGADDVVSVHSRSTAPSRGARAFSYPNYRDLRDGTTEVFANLAASSTSFVGLDVGRGPRRSMASAVTANYFQIFGMPLARGRSFTVEEERPGAGIRVAIISYPLWEQLGDDPGVLGRLVRISGEHFTVVGVAREGFAGTSLPGPDVWLPLGAHGTFSTKDPGRPFGARETHELSVVGRLRPGISVETAAATIATVGRRLEQAFPSVNAGYSLGMSKPSSRLMFMPGGGSGATAGLASLLMLMPVIVLLVTCLNLADLLLARSHVRRQELAIRSSLGGGRSRLTRQLLTEGLLLALAGAAAGLWLSTLATGTLLASLRQVLPIAVSLPDVSLDWRVLLSTLAFSLAATLVFAAGPALALTGRAAAADLKRRTGDDGRLPGRARLGNTLIIGQIALSLLLLASGGLFVMSALSASTADPGFRLDGGLVVQVDPALAGYDEARGREAHLALIDRLRTVPGVEAVTIGSRPPFTSIGESRDVAPAGAADARSRSVGAVFSAVGRDYARVLGLPMLGGRDFSDAELAPGSGERVAIIDDALAGFAPLTATPADGLRITTQWASVHKSSTHVSASRPRSSSDRWEPWPRSGTPAPLRASLASGSQVSWPGGYGGRTTCSRCPGGTDVCVSSSIGRWPCSFDRTSRRLICASSGSRCVERATWQPPPSIEPGMMGRNDDGALRRRLDAGTLTWRGLALTKFGSINFQQDKI